MYFNQNNLCFFLCLLFGIFCSSPIKSQDIIDNKQYVYQHPILFQPQKYVCYRSNTPLIIDGKIEESDWQKAIWTNDFVDIEGELKQQPPLNTQVKMLWDTNYLYIAAKLEEPHIWATLHQKDTFLFLNDNFEVFIDPDGDGHNYYELEVNAFNTIWDLLLLYPYHIDEKTKVLNNWEIKGLKSAVHIEGTLNNPKDKDQFWSVELALPWKALKELADRPSPPKNTDQWRINFSRVDWTMKEKSNPYEKARNNTSKDYLPANNWVWSPQGRIAMHHPETWGYVQFSTQKIGQKKVFFKENPDEKIKWALWQMHFQFITFYKDKKKYPVDLMGFLLPKVQLPNYNFQPRLHASPTGFRIEALSFDGKNNWSINEKGRVLSYK